MKHFIRRVLFFSLALVLFLFMKKWITPFYLGNELFKAKYEDYGKRHEVFNAVVFGSSRLYRHVNTVLLDSLLTDYGLSTYNFATGATFAPEAYLLYENFLQRTDSGTIETAFVELQELYRFSNQNWRTTNGSYWNNEKTLSYSIKYIKDSNYSEKEKKYLYRDYTKSYMYSFFDFLIFRNLLSTDKEKEIGINGFYPLDIAVKDGTRNNVYELRWEDFHSDTTKLASRIQSAQHAHETSSRLHLNETHLSYLNGLIEKSNQKGIHLFFVLPPRLTARKYNELVILSAHLPVDNSIQLYQYSKHEELYQVENSFDIGHLNSKGADIFSTYLAKEVGTIYSRMHKKVPIE